MSDNDKDNVQPEVKKISLAEAIKNKLAQKKADQISQAKNPKGTNTNGPIVKSQNHKKANNQRRRTGGS
jgi:hypothetical protein